MNSEERFLKTFLDLAESLPNPLNTMGEAKKWIKAYQAPKRAYHNLDHIAALLQWIDQLPEYFPLPQRAKWAALYHDCIYVATRKDNEARSADAATQFLSTAGMPAEEWNWIAEAIRRTAKHDGQGAPTEMQAFLDCDLSILGTEPSTYLLYSKAIRKEYRRISLKMYQQGRKQVLTHFLAREQIYFTPFFRDQLEEKARMNLKREIELLG